MAGSVVARRSTNVAPTMDLERRIMIAAPCGDLTVSG
jgi:hypothetical protein